MAQTHRSATGVDALSLASLGVLSLILWYRGPSTAEADHAVLGSEVAVIGLSVEVEVAQSALRERTDLLDVARATGALAARAVDCDGDGSTDFSVGAPLVCPSPATPLSRRWLSSVEANLAIANLGLSDFADATDDGNAFRGFVYVDGKPTQPMSARDGSVTPEIDASAGRSRPSPDRRTAAPSAQLRRRRRSVLRDLESPRSGERRRVVRVRPRCR